MVVFGGVVVDMNDFDYYFREMRVVEKVVMVEYYLLDDVNEKADYVHMNYKKLVYKFDLHNVVDQYHQVHNY